MRTNIPEVLTKDLIAGLEYALLTLNERERNISLWRYRDSMTRRTAAEYCHISPERVRQIEVKALRSQSNPPRVQYLRWGLAGYLNAVKTNAHNKGYMEGYRNGVLDCKEGRVDPSIVPESLDQPIQYLNLTKRPFNCLDRKGYRYIRDIAGLSREEIWKIRNLGAKGAQEIAEALVNCGIGDSEWNYYRFIE